MCSSPKDDVLPLDMNSGPLFAAWIDVGRLRPRKIVNVRKAMRLAALIEHHGWALPVVARLQNGRVIEGHVRLEAAKFLGLPQVPVRFLDISEEDADELARVLAEES